MKSKFSRPTSEQVLSGLVALAILAWAAPLLPPGRAPVWGTPALQFIPWRVAAWRMVTRAHAWPWWNPLSGLGAPLIANLQMAGFYPPTWALGLLAALGGVEALAWGHGLLLVLHLLWAALGMGLLARSLGLRAPGPQVAALAYALSGYLATRAEVFLSMNAATAWLPWVLWAGLALVRQPTARRAALLALAVSLQLLAGHAQTSWYTLVLLALWLGFWGTRPATRGRRGALVRRLALAAGLALLLTGVQTLPTAEYLLHSARASGVDRAFALTYSLWPWRLLGLVAPNLFGSPVTGDYWGYGAYYEDALYLGLLPLALALSTWTWAWKGRGGPGPWAPGLTRWAWAVVVLSLLLALGQNTPIFPWLYDHVPTFAMFQAPTRWSLLAEFALALLAGMRAAAWPAAGPRLRYGLNLALAAAPAAALLAVAAAWALPAPRVHTMARALAWAGLWAWGAVALARWRPRRPTRWWPGAVVAWVALDLLVSHAGWAPAVDAGLYAAPPPASPRGRVWFPFEEEYALKFDDFFRMTDLRPARPWEALRAVGLPNVRLLDPAATLNNFDPLVPARYVRLRQALDAPQPPGARERVLDRLGVVAEVLRDPTAQPPIRRVPRQPEPFVRWFPRAQVVADAPAAWQALWNRAARGGPVWTHTLVVEAVPLDTAVRGGPGAAPEPASWDAAYTDRTGARLAWARPRPDRVVVQVEAPGAGWLLVAEQAYPGWRAAVDGEAVPVYRAEYALMAVPVPPGRHTVVWGYRPWWWPTVGWVSLVAGALTLALVGRPWRRLDEEARA